MPREHTGHSKHPLPTREDSTHGHQHKIYIEIRLIIFFTAKDVCSLQPKMENSIQSAKTRPRADCGSDYELRIAKFRLKLKKVGKTIRPFRYDINKIPYAYTVEVTNRFKGLDLIVCLKNYGWRFMTLYRRQYPKPSPRKINATGKLVV